MVGGTDGARDIACSKRRRTGFVREDIFAEIFSAKGSGFWRSLEASYPESGRGSFLRGGPGPRARCGASILLSLVELLFGCRFGGFGRLAGRDHDPARGR